ncbi:transposase [Salsuginibacillus halophilus]|uniref:Transposase n=1 Tax=Salsuginibacillus halophilus TaxID=517424 RepID=A0A2P8HFP6_9BACI|nr:helix-turn-helix domain-containing protein [Salsuginibacillus halophilus]PSL45049.1 transposase [Salsuginibacillus halophilus]
MAKGQKHRDPEFQQYVSKMIVQDGHSIVKISKELDIPYSTIQKWVRKFRDQQRKEKQEAQSQLLTASEYKEMLEKEKQERLELEEENEILKKAMHIFTQEKS